MVRTLGVRGATLVDLTMAVKGGGCRCGVGGWRYRSGDDSGVEDGDGIGGRQRGLQ